MVSVKLCNVLHYSEYLHQDVILNICNFSIFGLIYRICSPKWRFEILFIILGRFCLMFNWKRADICPQISIENSCGVNASDDHGACTSTLVRARGGLTAL